METHRIWRNSGLVMKKVILDTNFLTLPYQFKIDIFEEIKRVVQEDHEILTLDCVVEELKKIAKGKGKNAIAARVALELMEKKGVKILRTKKRNTDKVILSISDENTIVATNDKELRGKLKDKKIKVLYLRSKKHLVIE